MATRIITKNGSGAPLASDLQQGELAVDLTNKRLYTENASGTVLELGTAPSTIDINAGTIDGTVIGGTSAAAGSFTTFTSTGIDDNATLTAITIDASENVGIGTTSPSAKLTIVGTTKVGEGVASNTSKLMVNTLSGTAAGIQLFQDGVESWIIDNPASSTALAFSNSGTERMRIDSSGNVGIGNTGFNAKLEVTAVSGEVFRADASGGAYRIVANQTGVNLNGNVGIGTTSPATPLHVKTNTTTNVGFFDYVGAATICGITDIGGSAELRVAGQVVSFTGAGGAGTEHMRIDASGNVLVGATTTPSGATSGIRLGAGVNSSISAFAATTSISHWLFYNGNGLVGSISTSGTSTAYNTSSDERLKENITDAPAGNIDDIKVRSFDWKADGEHQDYGMVAQELEAVAPYAVTKGQTEDDMWSVDYSKLVPMLIKEIQDLKAEVAALKGA